MFENKKGFTLIELLATIVILGLLALIVTPGIAKVIKNSKINTAKASLEGYVREIENASALYLTDTGKYPSSIDLLEIDGKNISKIENPVVELSNGGVVKVIAEIDGLYCVYEDGKGAECSEEPIIEYAYIKNSFDLKSLLKKYGISEICWYDYDNTLEYCDEEVENVDFAALYEEYDGEFYYKFFGIEIPREQIKSIVFTNAEPEGEGVDISLNSTNDVLLYYTIEDEMYDIKIYSVKEIMFPENSSDMFGDLYSLDKLILDNTNASNVTNMSSMFNSTGYSSEVFTLDLGDKFDTSNVTNMSNMFRGIGYSNPNFTLDLGDKFDTSNVTNMSDMFYNTGYSNPNFTLDLSGFNTSNVTNMFGMFSYSPNLKTIYVSDKWTTDGVTDSEAMFYNCNSLPNFNSSVVDKTNAHYNIGGYLTLKTNSELPPQ